MCACEGTLNSVEARRRNGATEEELASTRSKRSAAGEARVNRGGGRVNASPN